MTISAGMYRMLQQEVPSDYVLATGRTTSVRIFVEAAFRVVGITIAWRGQGASEVGYAANEAGQRVIVRIDTKYYRPAEVDLLLGDPTKAKDKLGWTAQTTLDQLCEEMVKADLVLADDPHDEMSKRDPDMSNATAWGSTGTGGSGRLSKHLPKRVKRVIDR